MADEGIFGIPQSYLGAGSSLLGAGSDLYSFFQEQQQRNQLKSIYDILQNPQKLNDYIGRLYQPMSAAQNTAIQRNLGANWAVNTGGAPGGAMGQFVADAMAKIEDQRYQETARNALAALSGASNTAQAYKSQPGGQLGAITKALQMLKQIKSTPPASGIADIPGYQDYRAGERAAFPSPVPVDQYMTEGYS